MSETFVAILQLHDKLDLQLYTIPRSQTATYSSIANAQQRNTGISGFEDPGALKTEYHTGHLRSSIQRNAGGSSSSDG